MRINICHQVKVKSSVAARIKKHNLSTWRIANRLGMDELDIIGWLNETDNFSGHISDDDAIRICNELGISVRLQITLHPVTEEIISKYGAKKRSSRVSEKGNDGND